MKINLSQLHEELQTAASNLRSTELALVHATNANVTAMTNYRNAMTSFDAGVKAVRVDASVG